jgi:hypothetical protein
LSTSVDAGSGQIYDHSFLGLFGQVAADEISNFTVDGTIEFGVVDNGVNMGVGSVAGYQPYGSRQTYDKITVNTKIKYTSPSSGNSIKDANVGGIVGYVKYGSTIVVEDCTYNGSIDNNSIAWTFYNSALIAFIENSGEQNITVKNTKISGNININSTSSQTGASVGSILAATGTGTGKTNITIQNVSVEGFKINTGNISTYSGGFLGFK